MEMNIGEYHIDMFQFQMMGHIKSYDTFRLTMWKQKYLMNYKV